MDEREPNAPITGKSDETPGAYWLKGYKDALIGRPAKPLTDKQARSAYLRGYSEGITAIITGSARHQ
jgi:ribosome modulation factor